MGDSYIKYISFSKAVLWKDRELSLRINIIRTLQMNDIKYLCFIDMKKGEKWKFTLDSILKNGMRRTVGQEEQFYFPIGLAEVIKLEEYQGI